MNSAELLMEIVLKALGLGFFAGGAAGCFAMIFNYYLWKNEGEELQKRYKKTMGHMCAILCTGMVFLFCTM